MASNRSDTVAAPRIAVVIPCMNEDGLVLEAVGSIREAEPVEVVVVDDGSDDPNTLSALDRLRRRGTRVIRLEERQGVSAARNEALASTSAPYVFPLDGDDLVCPGVLSAMADRLDAEPAAAACFGNYVEFGDHILTRGVPARIDPFRLAHTNEYPASALFRRTVIAGLGGWRRVGKKLDARADWNLWMTLAEHYATGIHLGEGPLTYLRRVHRGRLAEAARAHHRQIYRELRLAHPRLFEELASNRRASDMSALRKAFYPFVYGTRAWWPFEPRISRKLDRLGIWTLARRPHGDGREELERFVEEVREGALEAVEGVESRAPGYDRAQT